MRRYHFIVLLLIAPLFADAQNSWGVKGGLNVSTLGKQSSGFTTRLGYNFGMYATKRYFQELGMDIELLVSLQGARNSTINDSRLNYTYLALPVVADIFFHESISFELGLQFAYLLRAIQYEAGDKVDIKDRVNDFDFSGIIGLNYSKPYGNIGIRYVLGINNTNSAPQASETKIRNKVLQIYIAKSLNSKK